MMKALIETRILAARRISKEMIMDDSQKDEVFDYLNNLREIGDINMLGAGIYLQREFNFDRKEAREWVMLWMKEFKQPLPIKNHLIN